MQELFPFRSTSLPSFLKPSPFLGAQLSGDAFFVRVGFVLEGFFSVNLGRSSSSLVRD